jgi:hypothetical protein
MSTATLPAPRVAPAEAPAAATPTVRQLARQVFGLDLRSLALFRICLALVLLWDLQERAWDLRAHYSDDGILAAAAVPMTAPVSVHILNGSVAYQATLFVIAAACAVGLLVGWRTRVMMLLCWFLNVSLQARNVGIIHGGDSLLRNILFWCLFLPLGEYFSLDARRAGSPRPAPRYLSMATAAYVLQICLVYWFAALWKSDASWRVDGTALGIALHIDSLVTPIGIWLRDFETLTKWLTLGSIYLEVFGPVLLLLPFWTDQWRTLAVVLFLGFHLGIGLTMAIGIFPTVCMAAWLALLPPWFWDVLLPKVWARFRGPWAVGGDLPQPSATVSLLAGFFLVYAFMWNLHQLDRHDDTMREVRSWVGRDPGPEDGAGFLAGLKPRVRSWTGWDVQPPFFARFFPPQAQNLGNALGIQQGWGMFAPKPSGTTGWYVFVGTLDDESQVDLLTGGEPDLSPALKGRPTDIAASYQNARWRRFRMSLYEDPNFFWMRPLYADYLRREYERLHPGRQVVRVEFHFHWIKCDPERYDDPPVHEVIYRHEFLPAVVLARAVGQAVIYEIFSGNEALRSRWFPPPPGPAP